MQHLMLSACTGKKLFLQDATDNFGEKKSDFSFVCLIQRAQEEVLSMENLPLISPKSLK